MKTIFNIDVLPIKFQLLPKKPKTAISIHHPSRYEEPPPLKTTKLPSNNTQKIFYFNYDLEKPNKDKSQILRRPYTCCFKKYQRKTEDGRERNSTTLSMKICSNQNKGYWLKTIQPPTNCFAKLMKNYFPLRKSKKNADPKWHNNFLFIKHHQQSLKSNLQLKNNKVSESNTEQDPKPVKLKKRCFSSSACLNLSKQQKKTKKLVNDLSPWNTNYLLNGNHNCREECDKIDQFI